MLELVGINDEITISGQIIYQIEIGKSGLLYTGIATSPTVLIVC